MSISPAIAACRSPLKASGNPRRSDAGIAPRRCIFGYEMHRLAYLLAPSLIAASTALSLKPVKWSLVGAKVPREVAAGRAVPITVQADIAKGWHIYSLTQKPG